MKIEGREVKGGATAAWASRAEHAEARIRKLDRRHDERQTIMGEGIAAFIDGEGGAKVCKIEFIDASGMGLGVRCGIAVAPGARFTLRPDSGLSRAHSGVVSRCTSDGEGYRLGLRLSLAAAA
jgi:hypothetical protein